MRQKEKLILVGGGGHCQAAIEVIEAEGKFKIAGIVDQKERLNQKVLGYTIFASDEDLAKLAEEYQYFLITLGQIKSADKRKEKFQFLQAKGVQFPTILSPYAVISKHAKIGEGTIVLHQASINAGAKIGQNCIINTGACIEHDCSLGNHCHVSTHSVINGECIIEDQVFIGSNSVLANDITVAKNTVIGAGSVVLKSLSEAGVYVGNPVRRLKS